MQAETGVVLGLLHEGGWDEVIMVAVGLGIAYLVIVWSGRRKGDEDDDEFGADADDGDNAEAVRAEAPRERDAVRDRPADPPD
jgi:hypothetical protein